jgi:hypothetical protein
MTTTKPTSKAIDKFIAGYPEEIQVILNKVRETIRKAAPEAEETINYGIPTFTLNGNLVHFSAFKSIFSKKRGNVPKVSSKAWLSRSNLRDGVPCPRKIEMIRSKRTLGFIPRRRGSQNSKRIYPLTRAQKVR